MLGFVVETFCRDSVLGTFMQMFYVVKLITDNFHKEFTCSGYFKSKVKAWFVFLLSASWIVCFPFGLSFRNIHQPNLLTLLWKRLFVCVFLLLDFKNQRKFKREA